MSEKSIRVSQYFECPSCGYGLLDEVMTGVTVSTTISDLHFLEKGEQPWIANDSVDVEYGIKDECNPDMCDGVVDRYQCMKCGWIIRDEDNRTIDNPEDLFTQLQIHRLVREKERNTP